MKNLPYLTSIYRAFASVLIVMAVAGCVSVASLDDVEFIDVSLATTDDLTRYAQAQENRSREIFGGASFSDGKGNVLVSFSSSEYDQYLAYEREHPAVRPTPQAAYRWPVMRIAFRSSRVLFDPDAAVMPTVVFYRCRAGNRDGRLYGFGDQDVIWQDRFLVRPERAREIAEALRQGRPQTYEVFFDYVYWDHVSPYQRGQSITLLPLPDDLCIALTRSNYPLWPSMGRPLRISKDAVNAAVGPLPQRLPAHNGP